MSKSNKTYAHSEFDYSTIHESKIPRIEAWVMIILLLILTASGLLLIDLQ